MPLVARYAPARGPAQRGANGGLGGGTPPGSAIRDCPEHQPPPSARDHDLLNAFDKCPRPSKCTSRLLARAIEILTTLRRADENNIVFLAQLHVGGLVAVGVDRTGRYLLTVSHSGRGVFDTRTWRRIARDSALAYPVDGHAIGIGPLAGQTIPVREINYDTSRMTEAPVGAFVVSYEEGGVVVKSAGT